MSLDRQLQEAIETEEGETRYLDLCLALRRQATGEILLWAGDKWDRLEKRFCGPGEPHIVDVVESQVEFVRWFATWLKAYREGAPRDISVVLNHGMRRGGKTTIAVLCQIAALIDVPAIAGNRPIGWVISETFKKRDEIEENIRRFIPFEGKWYRHWKAPEFRYEFVNGAVLRNLSAQDPEDLRQGRADILVYNEPQQMVAQAVVNGMYGTTDKSGLTILACNPPTQVKGEWMVDLKEAIDNKDVEGVIDFFFDARLNPMIDQPARGRIGKIAKIINPKQLQADDEGTWARLGDRAYPKWHRQYARPVPSQGDVTADVIYRKTGFRGYGWLGGVDFQGYPFNTAVLWKVFAGKDGWIYWAVDEFFEEGAEINLLEEVRQSGYDERDIFWIGDASGSWQNYRHEQGNRSFQEFKRDGWVIRPPRQKKDPKSQNASNPPVEQRLRVISRLMESGRLLVDPDRCPRLVESYKECPLKKDGARYKKYGQHAHETDAADYALYWCDPKPMEASQLAPVKDLGLFSIDIHRRGADVI